MHTASETEYHTSAYSHHLAVVQLRRGHERGNTIIDTSFDMQAALGSMLIDGHPATHAPVGHMSEKLFKIRAADSHDHRSSASILINKMYAIRGYASTGLPVKSVPYKVTLVAEEADETVGTITVGFDCSAGLAVDDLFREEVDMIRWRGLRVCEFTKLALDHVVRSKRVLASLFHVAYIYAHRLKNFDALLIEVHPRHVAYYQRMLGFVVAGPKRFNKRVQAPAVLMALDFSHAHSQIAKLGGRPYLSKQTRSLYPYFFSSCEEAGIVARLRPS